MDDYFDDDLKQIMGHRYKEDNHAFTPEAQKQRKNNRLKFTYRISAFLGVLTGFMIWAHRAGLIAYGVMIAGVITCAMIVGFNMAVCVCHNQGWRGA